MKVERFIREYAAYQKRYVKEKAFFTEEEKIKAIKKIDRAVRFRQAGQITVEEAMKMIMEVI